MLGWSLPKYNLWHSATLVPTVPIGHSCRFLYVCVFQGGAGYIVTLSQTIRTKEGAVAAVMGMDMTIGYFYQVRSADYSCCTTDSITCIQTLRHPPNIEGDKGLLGSIISMQRP